MLFGRRALWGVLAFTWLCVLVGVGHELRAGADPGLTLEIAAGMLVSFLVVAVVFDGSWPGSPPASTTWRRAAASWRPRAAP
ncbi:hypothetical protein HML84_16945 [Alcanivorax sp. IO_7]|nr:hypothetical protein HML84_16945 [Alcanivorax sp. IO_7]